jgi:IS6 family transposase
VSVSRRRDLPAARRFFEVALGDHGRPAEVVTDMAPSMIRVVEDLLPDACHDTERFANNRVESDHARLKARLRPMRGLQRDPTAAVVIQGHAFVQGHPARSLRTRRQRPNRSAPPRRRVRRARRRGLT